ncbi:carboxypeptidase-like regulatory domain-containing protein [Ornithinibacillus californiensis]|uniref:carboxypeptidase-like regulatory domain-containing protein n=1 Tax=Ornithinibacillus californiensis TaxID=161536 RepID=UPI00064DE423|nr:carboxypeptidase-like regulatory domain-containing protein [Ornithinibacillus californiensis]
MRIKVKVKHLVLTVIALGILTPLFTNVIFPYVKLAVAENNISNGEKEKKQEIMELLQTTSLDTKKWEIIRDYMIEDGITGSFDVYISPSFTQWGGPDESERIYFSREEKLPFLIDYVENGPADGFLATAASALAIYYERDGEIEKAKQVLYDASKRFSTQKSYQSNQLLVERIRITKNHGQYKEATHYIEELLSTVDADDFDMHGQIAQLRTEIILQQGNIEEAYAEVTEAIKEYEELYAKEQEQWPESKDDSIDNLVFYQQLNSLERSLRLAMEKYDKGTVSTVSGKILRSDGTPVEGVGVYLRDENNANRSVMAEDTYQIVTDKEGRYEFRGVIPDNYQITLGFYYDQISGWTWPLEMDEWIEVDGRENISYNITLQKLIEVKQPINQEVIKDDVIHFEWEAVEGAAYYGIGLGYEIDNGSVGSGIFKKGIRDTSIEIPIEEIYQIHGGVTFGEDDVVDSKSLLAYTNPNNRFFWKVEAYDENDVLITSSNGYRLDDEAIKNIPIFYMKERELTNADQLLLDHKIEKALAEYKANYESNPNDIHSLQMIIRLIGINGDGTIEKWDELAITYKEDYARKTNNPESIFDVAHYYYRQYNWEVFNKWMDVYIAEVGELSEYTQAIYASALMKQGKHEEANKQFIEALNKDGSHRFVGHWIANELYRTGLTDKVVEIAIDYPQLGPYEGKPDWLLLVKNILEESNKYDQYEQELKEVLDIYFSGEEEELETWLNTTDKVAMKKLINAIKEVR